MITRSTKAFRRIASVLSGLLVMLSAELGMSSIVSFSGAYDLSIPGQQLALSVVAIAVFAVAGLIAGFVAVRPDVVPLIAVEVVAVAFVLLSAVMSAVEVGVSDVLRNVIVGTIGLAVLAVMYWAGQRLKRQMRA